MNIINLKEDQMRLKRLKLIALLLLGIGLTGMHAQTVKDIDGNVYKTVKIDTQEWMAENLKTTMYNDGTAIPLVINNTKWNSVAAPAPGYCWYNNDQEKFGNKYGALYNWYTVNTGKLCPSGWHVPGNEEWTNLTTYLGGENVAGGKLKETGTTHWAGPNTGANNETRFTARPGGLRYSTGSFNHIGLYGYWWSATEGLTTRAWGWVMSNNHSTFSKLDFNKLNGFSVRCVK